MRYSKPLERFRKGDAIYFVQNGGFKFRFLCTKSNKLFDDMIFIVVYSSRQDQVFQFEWDTSYGTNRFPAEDN